MMSWSKILTTTHQRIFCESCIGGKQHRTPFDSSERHTVDLLELVHSDVCGKISEPSIGGAQYFLTFTDDKSRYSWVYILKTKDQVFDYFLEWKALVEKATKKKIRTLRTDNGGEYTSTRFQEYLKAEGIRYELTVPKTPQQNGVAERLNRTLVRDSSIYAPGCKTSKAILGRSNLNSRLLEKPIAFQSFEYDTVRSLVWKETQSESFQSFWQRCICSYPKR